MYDVVVVGARCAGAPLAMLLARAGRRVALLDRATFPSDTMSTHFLWPRSVAQLAGWGLLDELQARGCTPIPEITFDVGSAQLRGTGPPVNGVTDSYCPRRTVLDALLVDAAVAAGVELIDGYVVDDLTWLDGRVTGVVGSQGRTRAPSSIRARLVVGADGLRSTVADRVAAQAYRYEAPLTCVYYSYWSGLQDRAGAFHARPGQLVLTWPTNDELTCVYVAWPVDHFAHVRLDVSGAFLGAVQQIPGLADQLAAGQRVAPFTGTRTLPNQYRTSAGPGWALIGDAGHHKDPSTGMGIADAFTSAALLAARLPDAVENAVRLDDALASYQGGRDAATASGWELTLSTARLWPLSPQLDAFYRAAASQPAVTERIFGVLGGTVPISAVYSRAHMEEVSHRGSAVAPA